MSSTPTRVACAIGFHQRHTTTQWTPSIHAPIVTEFRQETRCARCGKTLDSTHWVWNGTDMVDAEDSSQ